MTAAADRLLRSILSELLMSPDIPPADAIAVTLDAHAAMRGWGR